MTGVESNKENDPAVAGRIKARLELLMTWKRTGIPAGCSVPISLAKARLWENPELGILRIGSKRDFLTTHSEWGEDVKCIGDLLRELKGKKSKGTQYRSERAKRIAAEAKIELLETRVESLLKQVHEAGDREEIAQNRSKLADARRMAMKDDLDRVLKENAELVRLVANSGQSIRQVSR